MGFLDSIHSPTGAVPVLRPGYGRHLFYWVRQKELTSPVQTLQKEI
jgi:hypothetical protein